MGTLKKLRLAKQADIALQDIDGDGNVDRLALDVSGDGWFDLFIDDTDRNGVPDKIFFVKYGNDEELDKVEVLAAGPEVEQEILAVAQEIALLIEAKEIIGEELCLRLNELDRRVSKSSRLIRAAQQ